MAKQIDEDKKASLLSQPPSLEQLRNIVRRVSSNWKAIGLNLGIKDVCLSAIEKRERYQERDCCAEMFSDWLNLEPHTGSLPLTWGTVLSAIEKVDRVASEELLAELMGNMESPVTPLSPIGEFCSFDIELELLERPFPVQETGAAAHSQMVVGTVKAFSKRYSDLEEEAESPKMVKDWTEENVYWQELKSSEMPEEWMENSKMSSAQKEGNHCPCTNKKQFPASLEVYSVLTALHSEKSILTDKECCRVGKEEVARDDWWDVDLAVAVAAKPEGVVQQTLKFLEDEHSWVATCVKVLSELFQKRLVSEKDLERMAEQSGSLSARLGVPVKLNKRERESIVNKTATVLDDFKYKEAANKLRALNELLTTELLTVEECTQVVEEGNRWGKYLTLILASKSVEEEASEVLEKHGCHVKDLKLLSKLFKDRLVTEDDIKRMKDKRGNLPTRLILVHFTKPEDQVYKTAAVLDNFGCKQEASELRVLSELFQKRLISEKDLERMAEQSGSLSARLGVPVKLSNKRERESIVNKTATVLDDFKYKEAANKLRALNELLTTELLTVKECTQVVEEGNRWGEYLTLILASKFVEEEASEVLEKHGCHVKDLKLLSKLFKEQLLTMDDINQMKDERGNVPTRLILVHCTKPEDQVYKTAAVLDNFECKQEASELRVLSKLFKDHLVTEDDMKRLKDERGNVPTRLILVHCTKPEDQVYKTAAVLDNFGCKQEASELRVLNELLHKGYLTRDGCCEVATAGHTWGECVARLLLNKPVKVVQEVTEVLEKHGCSGKDLKVLQVLQANYEKFKTNLDAGAIGQTLAEKGVIMKSLAEAIANAVTREEKNKVLYDDLLRYGTEDTLIAVCEVVICMAHSQEMLALGQSLAEELKRGVEILESFEVNFFQYMDAQAISEALLTNGVIPVHIQRKIAATDDANDVLFDYLMSHCTKSSLLALCEVASEKMDKGKDMLCRLEQVCKQKPAEVPRQWKPPLVVAKVDECLELTARQIQMKLKEDKLFSKERLPLPRLSAIYDILQAKGVEILECFEVDYFQYMDAQAVSEALLSRGVIPVHIQREIAVCAGREEANEVLFDCLMSHCTKSSLLALCEVASEKMGNEGKEMLRRLQQACKQEPGNESLNQRWVPPLVVAKVGQYKHDSPECTGRQIRTKLVEDVVWCESQLPPLSVIYDIIRGITFEGVEVLESFEVNFIQYMDAQAISEALLSRRVIPVHIQRKMAASAGREEANEVLFDHLMSHCTKSSLLALCEVASEKMGKEGKEMLRRLEQACRQEPNKVPWQQRWVPPRVVANVKLYKDNSPELSGQQIRTKLFEDRVCNMNNLPPLSAIYDILRRIPVEDSLHACLEANREYLIHHPDVTCFYTSNKIIGGRKTNQRCLVIGVRKKKKESELKEQRLLPKMIQHGWYRHLVDVVEEDPQCFGPGSFLDSYQEATFDEQPPAHQGSDKDPFTEYSKVQGGHKIKCRQYPDDGCGTLGFFAEKEVSMEDGQKQQYIGFVTCKHVAQGLNCGLVFYEDHENERDQSLKDKYDIATVKIIGSDNYSGEQPNFNVDAAFAQLKRKDLVDIPPKMKTKPHYCNFDKLTVQEEMNWLQQDQPVCYCTGKSNKLAKGRILDCAFNWPYFTCEVEATPIDNNKVTSCELEGYNEITCELIKFVGKFNSVSRWAAGRCECQVTVEAERNGDGNLCKGVTIEVEGPATYDEASQQITVTIPSCKEVTADFVWEGPDGEHAGLLKLKVGRQFSGAAKDVSEYCYSDCIKFSSGQAQPGDSGSLLRPYEGDENDHDLPPLGLVTGGYQPGRLGYANRISKVLKALDVKGIGGNENRWGGEAEQ